MEYELKSVPGTVVRAEKECDVYCPICHKVLHVNAGEVIPRCCGKVMEVWDCPPISDDKHYRRFPKAGTGVFIPILKTSERRRLP